MQECSQAGSHNEGQFGRSTRTRQLRDRESRRSKLISRRTERQYKVMERANRHHTAQPATHLTSGAPAGEA